MSKKRLSNRDLTAGYVAVYRAQYGRPLDEVLRVLHKAGLAAQSLDAPEQPLWDKTSWTRKVTVGVPPDEAESAREALAEWNRETAPKVAASVAELRKQLLLSLIPPAACSLILLLLSSAIEGEAWIFVPVVWIAGIVLISHIRRKGKKEERDGTEER